MTKITDLSAATTPLDSTDLIEVVQDVAGTPTNRKVAVADLPTGGGGGGGVTVASAIGDGSGDHALTTTFGDVHATLYDLSVPAVAGDLLVLTWQCRWFGSAAGRRLLFRFVVNGTAIAAMGTDGYVDTYSGDGPQHMNVVWPHTVLSGDISGGNVPITVQAKESAADSVIANAAATVPLLMAQNFGQ